MRTCWCGEELVRKPNETLRDFNKRETCDRVCSAILKAHKKHGTPLVKPGEEEDAPNTCDKCWHRNLDAEFEEPCSYCSAGSAFKPSTRRSRQDEPDTDTGLIEELD